MPSCEQHWSTPPAHTPKKCPRHHASITQASRVEPFWNINHCAKLRLATACCRAAHICHARFTPAQMDAPIITPGSQKHHARHHARPHAKHHAAMPDCSKFGADLANKTGIKTHHLYPIPSYQKKKPSPGADETHKTHKCNACRPSAAVCNPG